MINWHVDTDRLIHSCKTAVACIIGFILIEYSQFPGDQWILITIIVVMCAQLYVGSVVQKAYLRFLGTVIGCLFAVAVMLLFGTSSLILAIAIGFATFIFSYMATSQESLSYVGTLGAVTTVIILIGQEPTVTIVIERFIEISIGILLATLVSQFFLPINARTHLRRQQAATLGQIRDFYIATLVKHRVELESDLQTLDEAIVKSLFRQRQLAAESAREFLGTKFSPKHFSQTLQAEREIIRSVAFMRHAYQSIDNARDKIDKLPSMQQYHTSVENALNTLIRAINTKKSSSEHIHLPNVTLLREALPPSIGINDREQIIFIDAYLFGAELLSSSLGRIATLYGVGIGA